MGGGRRKGGMTGQITDPRTTDGKKGWAISRDCVFVSRWLFYTLPKKTDGETRKRWLSRAM